MGSKITDSRNHDVLGREARRIGAVLLAASLAACGGGMASMSAPVGSGPTASEAAPPAPTSTAVPGADTDEKVASEAPAASGGAVGPKEGESTPAEPSPSTASDPQQRRGLMLVYVAKLQLAVFRATQATELAQKLALARGGYVVRREDHALVVRVPTPRFEEVLTAMATLGEVVHREVQVQDVTAEFVDLRTRLQNLVAVRDRLERILERADKVDGALAVEKELARVTSDIERIKGRLALLRELVAYSTITVELQELNSETTAAFTLPFAWLRTLGLPALLSIKEQP